MQLRSLAISALLLCACLPRGVLVAETGEHRLVARDPASGVTIVLTTSAWDGQPSDLESGYTVVHALVSNLGERPVVLAPGNLQMVSRRGFQYDLLDAGGSFYRRPTPDDSGYQRHDVPGYDSGRSHGYGTIRAPGSDVASAALPWGVLEPGTQMRGFLFFEKVEDSANGARLWWHVETPEHAPVADFAFDLYVARPRT